MMDFFEIVYDYDFILQLITVCVSLIITFKPLNKDVKSIVEMILHFVILFSFGTLMNWGLFELSRVARFLGGINFPISYLVLILGYLFFIRIPFTNRLLMGGTLFVSVMSIVEFSRQALFMFDNSTSSSSISSVFYILILLFSILLHNLSLKEYTDLPSLSALMMFIITVILSTLIIVREIINVKNGTFEFSLFDSFLLISYYFISVCSYLMVYYYAKARKSLVQLQVENKLLEADKERVDIFESTQEDFHQLRHDLSNQLNIMQIILEKKNYEELDKFFKSMYDDFVQSSNIYDFIDCGNSIINSVVNMELVKARKANVEIKTNINVASDLPFETSDICRILVNLMDNAIEALERIDIDNKHIDCSILNYGEYLYIGVHNKISKEANPDKVLRMNTEKEDQVNHGFGHRIVKKIANKYNGHVNYSIENDLFYAEVMLDMKYNTKEGRNE